YEKAELTKCSLQKVCRAWDKYLCQYTYQFVHICNMVHGTIPTKYLQYAV
ncbi:hypothetical protein CPB86DRAFT_720354, partial [Serendipita vermifera]